MLPGNLLGLSLEELASLPPVSQHPSFRARQLYHGLYNLRRKSLAEMTELSRAFRRDLAQGFEIRLPAAVRRQTASDGTEKFLLRLDDGEFIEMVHIPEPRRSTLCISSQVGCNAGCRFCVTATMGLRRNLTVAEIVGQVLLCEQFRPGELKRFNLVFMGMGEPLLNYEATMKAFRLLADPLGIAISPRRITLSTCGIVPGLQRLAREAALPQIAISLGAPTDELRSQLIPINRKWNLACLLEACRKLPVRGRITFEYTLIRGVNDSAVHAQKLAKLLHGLRTKVNLIPMNPHPLVPAYLRPKPEAVVAFQETLAARGIAVFLRRPRGEDISAACGQLVVGQSLPD